MGLGLELDLELELELQLELELELEPELALEPTKMRHRLRYSASYHLLYLSIRSHSADTSTWKRW